MKGRTYRYFNGPVQYPFGFGLSYTSFVYQSNQSPLSSYGLKDTISVTLNVKNTGKIAADEVVQAYIQYPDMDRMPVKELKAFKRVAVVQGGAQTVTIKIPVIDLQKWDLKKNNWLLYPGEYQLVLGSSSQDSKLSYKFKLE